MPAQRPRIVTVRSGSLFVLLSPSAEGTDLDAETNIEMLSSGWPTVIIRAVLAIAPANVPSQPRRINRFITSIPLWSQYRHLPSQTIGRPLPTVARITVLQLRNKL